MLPPISIPPSQEINNWNTLRKNIIVETVSRSVPLTEFIKIPNEQSKRYLSLKSNLPATQCIKMIEEISYGIKIIDSFLAKLYALRPKSPPLLNYIEKIKQFQGITTTPNEFQSSQAKAAAHSLLDPLLEFLNKVQEDCTQISSEIAIFFANIDFWKKGFYSDILLDKICLLLFKITALEQIAPSKKGLANDISSYLKIIDDRNLSQDVQIIRMWIADTRIISSTILEKLKCIDDSQHMLNLFNIFYRYIRRKIDEDSYIYPDMFYSYINALIFFYRVYDKQIEKENMEIKNTKKKKRKAIFKAFHDDHKYLIQKLIMYYPNLLLLFEFATDITFNIPKDALTKINSKSSVTPLHYKPISLETLMMQSKTNFNELTHLITILISKKKSLSIDEKIFKFLIKILHHVSSTLNTIRQKLSQVLSNPPVAPNTEEGQKMTPFQRSMKIGLKNDLNLLLLIIYILRSTKELIQLNLPLLMKSIASYIQNYLQNFAYNKMPISIIRNEKIRSTFGVIMEKMRCLIGNLNESDLEIKEKKKYGKIKPKFTDCSPHISIIELLQVQIQNFINPESEFYEKTGIFSSALLSSEDKKEFEQFLEDTKYFNCLLKLQETIDIVFDQSNLYFKEHYLGLHEVSFFPVTTSLPVILSDYAIKNYYNTELTNAIFYPLSIYDDAASCALKYLKSQFIYEEIKEEAKICVMTIVRLITDSAFHSIKKYASIQYLTYPMKKYINKKRTPGSLVLKENTIAFHIGNILHQNQLCILGCQVDTKTNIAERLNELFDQEITKILGITEKFGVLSIISVSHLLKILFNTHSMFLNFGLPIMPFDELFSRAISSDTPNSFQSLLLFNISEHMNNKLIKDFYLLTNPNRLIPKKQPNVDISSLYIGNVGTLMTEILFNSSMFVTVENFRELFWLLNDGSIPILQSQLLNTLTELYNVFIKFYKKINGKLIRIKDNPINMSCDQAFDRFEGAYRYFVLDNDVLNVLDSMSRIGNLIIISKMIDEACQLKNSSTKIISTFVLSRHPNNKIQNANSPEIFDIFDKQFLEVQKSIEGIEWMPHEDEVVHPFLLSVIRQLVEFIKQSLDEFKEVSTNLLDFQTMKGFTASWAVLEFIYILIEVYREKGALAPLSAIAEYGEGAHLTAAIILMVTKQKSLYEVLSIGGRIMSHMKTDLNTLKDIRVKRFVTAYKLMKSALLGHMATFEQFIENIEG